MSSADHKTSWTILARAASGDSEAQERFAKLYSPVLRAYFVNRWKGSPFAPGVEDAIQDVFVDCLRPNGVLEKAKRDYDGGFRAYFYAVARTIALRCEASQRRDKKQAAGLDLDLDRVPSDDDSLSTVFDRAWAKAIVREAVHLHRERVRSIGGREKLQVEILRLRFAEGHPIREIAPLLNLTPELTHQEYRMARRAFGRVLEDVVDAHSQGDPTDIKERCREILRLLG